MNNSQGKPYFSIILVIGCILAISLVVIFSPPALASIPPLIISGHIPKKIPAHKSTDNPVDSRPFFDNFSWQSFIALNWPADVTQGRGVSLQPDNPLKFYHPPQDTPVVWETYREAFDLFPPDGNRPPSWNDSATYDPCNETAKPGDKTFVMLSKSGTLLEDRNRNEDDLDEFNEAFAFHARSGNSQNTEP
jgi:hypothetical protein